MGHVNGDWGGNEFGEGELAAIHGDLDIGGHRRGESSHSHQ